MPPPPPPPRARYLLWQLRIHALDQPGRLHDEVRRDNVAGGADALVSACRSLPVDLEPCSGTFWFGKQIASVESLAPIHTDENVYHV